MSAKRPLMIFSMDLYLRLMPIGKKKTTPSLRHHRVWDKDLFLARLRERCHPKAAEPEDRVTVEVITRQEFLAITKPR
jgi:hypothetical protein